LQKELAALIAETRRRAGLTQTEVAARLSRPQSFVATVERGQRRIDVIELLNLGEAIGFDPAEIVAHLQKVSKGS